MILRPNKYDPNITYYPVPVAFIHHPDRGSDASYRRKTFQHVIAKAMEPDFIKLMIHKSRGKQWEVGEVVKIVRGDGMIEIKYGHGRMHSHGQF